MELLTSRSATFYVSSAFNTVVLLPLDAADRRSLLAIVSETHALTCLCTIIIYVPGFNGAIISFERRIRLFELDAFLAFISVLDLLRLIYLVR